MSKKFFPLFLIFVLFFSLFLFSCRSMPSSSSTPAVSPMTLTATDYWGNEVQLKQKPTHVVSLGPSATEIMASLSAMDLLVGVTTADDYPTEVAQIEKVGEMDNPSLEKILSLNPDLVLAVFGNPMTLIENLRDQSIPVFGMNPQTVNEVIADIKKVGNLVGREDKAEEVVRDIEETIGFMEERLAKTATLPTVYLETWPQPPYYTFGAGTFGDDLIRLAGGINIASSIDEPYPALADDYIIFENPQAIILAYMTNQSEAFASLWSRTGWEKIAAVQEGKVLISADPNVYLRPGPRLKEALLELAHFLHPEWF